MIAYSLDPSRNGFGTAGKVSALRKHLLLCTGKARRERRARKALTFLPPDDVVVSMKLRSGFVYSALILIFFGALYLLTKAFDLLNRPSDRSVFYGILIIVALVALVPSALHWIWHHHVTPHAEPQAPFTRKKENDANT